MSKVNVSIIVNNGDVISHLRLSYQTFKLPAKFFPLLAFGWVLRKTKKTTMILVPIFTGTQTSKTTNHFYKKIFTKQKSTQRCVNGRKTAVGTKKMAAVVFFSQTAAEGHVTLPPYC